MKATIVLPSLLCFYLTLLSGCGGEEILFGAGPLSNLCKDEIREVTKSYGDPEEIDEYEYTTYFTHYYWYYSEGIAFRFDWGDSIDGCETQTYTFSPF